ncbi:MAG TPA: 50S ribosomal protein L15 [Vicinamibacterales bacterium]|nr:50S ribosomal protein L15 [Vicinamibacterales bacterium]
MSLSNLRPPKGAKHARKRVGRGPGSGHGKTASRGSKGAKSRSGFRFKRGFEGGQMPLHRRVPKRGFTNIFRVEYAVVNLDTLAEVFEAGSAVTPELLRERGLVRQARAPIKVLGRGEISKALTVRAHRFSGSAAEKIAKAGGSVERLEPIEEPRSVERREPQKAAAPEVKAEGEKAVKSEKAEKPKKASKKESQ